MKTATLIFAFVLLALPVLAGDHPTATKSGWFDLENCAFCKNLTTDPELLEHITWETHKITNGMMYISTCDPEYTESYHEANAAMEKLGGDMMSGNVDPMQVKMCGSCAEFGQLLMGGASMQSIDGDAADVTLITSSDPAMVAKLHNYADRNNKEMAEMTGSSQ